MTAQPSDIYRCIESSFRKQAVMTTLGAELVLAERGRVSIRLAFREELTQQHGYLHAGIVSTIADSACGYAALTALPEGKEVLTVEYKINLLSPASGQYFQADARVVRSGKTLSVCTAEVLAHEDGIDTPIATMTATIFAVSERN